MAQSEAKIHKKPLCSYHVTYAFQSESTLYIAWMSFFLEVGVKSEV